MACVAGNAEAQGLVSASVMCSRPAWELLGGSTGGGTAFDPAEVARWQRPAPARGPRSECGARGLFRAEGRRGAEVPRCGWQRLRAEAAGAAGGSRAG